MQERSINWLPPIGAWMGDGICSLAVCPDWESNPPPFSYGTTRQPTEPHRPGQTPPIFSKPKSREPLTSVMCGTLEVDRGSRPTHDAWKLPSWVTEDYLVH